MFNSYRLHVTDAGYRLQSNHSQHIHNYNTNIGRQQYNQNQTYNHNLSCNQLQHIAKTTDYTLPQCHRRNIDTRMASMKNQGNPHPSQRTTAHVDLGTHGMDFGNYWNFLRAWLFSNNLHKCPVYPYHGAPQGKRHEFIACRNQLQRNGVHNCLLHQAQSQYRNFSTQQTLKQPKHTCT